MFRKTFMLWATLSIPWSLYAERAEHSWQNLKHLGVGQKIEVVDTRLVSVKGTFRKFSEDALWLQVGERETIVQRPSILRVSLREQPRRLRGALKGLAIGGGAGLLVSVAFGDKREGALRRIAPVCAGVGAAVGAALPNFETIYRASKEKSVGFVPKDAQSTVALPSPMHGSLLTPEV